MSLLLITAGYLLCIRAILEMISHRNTSMLYIVSFLSNKAVPLVRCCRIYLRDLDHLDTYVYLILKYVFHSFHIGPFLLLMKGCDLCSLIHTYIHMNIFSPHILFNKCYILRYRTMTYTRQFLYTIAFCQIVLSLLFNHITHNNMFKYFIHISSLKQLLYNAA